MENLGAIHLYIFVHLDCGALMADAGAWNRLDKVASSEVVVEKHGMNFLAGRGSGDGALGKGGEKEGVRRRHGRYESGGARSGSGGCE
ncbi:hypothetical protein E5676_scaffold255G008360 [Cucumis melo var. makuwa]|uniref:Uncharacterized protein n=2 Tax=Cucumis melo TaxID=3656 RepID=A0A5A7UEL8_CUCMM|nr:hypothetical protein E6C27_scaffold120G002140 [Cucumis melo var. makuwa]TYK13221.1 hypothetical protein E5676_scaffold255G008360 [Cucumis melo var. makuwa]